MNRTTGDKLIAVIEAKMAECGVHKQYIELLLTRNGSLVLEQLAYRINDLGKQLSSEYFVPIFDEDVPAHLSELLAKWRKMAVMLNYDGPIVWSVKAGFNLIHHSQLYANNFDCYPELRKGMDHSLIFWMPKFIPNSNDKTVQEQLAILTDWQRMFELPEGHLCLGEASIIGGLILSYFRFSCEDYPKEEISIHTETIDAEKNRYAITFGNMRHVECGSTADESHKHKNCYAFPLAIIKDYAEHRILDSMRRHASDLAQQFIDRFRDDDSVIEE